VALCSLSWLVFCHSADARLLQRQEARRGETVCQRSDFEGNTMNAIVMLEGPYTRDAEIEAFKREFLRYAEMPDIYQPCPVGRLTVNRRQTVAEVVFDAMTESRDFESRAMELLCKMANGWYVTTEAAALLSDMAEHWAELRCDL
jgi:hypothetical protein